MIFRPELVAKIKTDDKTMTRRRVKKGEHACRYQGGRDYAVQPGRGQKSVCRIRVTDVRREPLGTITAADARAEGFPDIAGFARYWLHLYHPDPDMRVAIMRPAVHPAAIADEHALEHFTGRYGMAPVWVITFERVIFDERRARPGVPVFLAPTGRGADYTTDRFRAIPDEPEAVPPDEIAALPTTMEAKQRWIMDRAAAEVARSSEPLEVQVARALASARAAGVDTARYEREIAAKIRSLEARARRKAA